LINFNVRVLKQGLKRIVNDFPDSVLPTAAASGTLTAEHGEIAEKK
jgi:hypothetical protein